MKKHVIIVGAGPGGLTSAMILARRGFRVTVFEKANRVGGRNAALESDGFRFDTGPTFLMMSFILEEMFREAGKEMGDYLKLVNLDPLYRLSFEDMEFLPSADHGRTEEQIERLFPGNGKGFQRFVQRERQRFEHLFPCLQKDYASLKAFLNPIFIKALPHLALGQSIFGKLGSYFDNDKLKICFTFQSKYLGMSPWECPALFTILPYLEHAMGIQHVEGGLSAISEAMARVVEENGGTIHTGCAVKRILVRDRKVIGVELENGEKYECDDLIINADFAYAMSSLFDSGTLRKFTDNRLRKMRYSCSTFMLYLSVDRVYKDIPHHSIIFAGDYKKNVDEISVGMTLPEDPSIYIQNAVVSDNTLAPEGKSTIYILVPVPNNISGVVWKKEQTAYMEKALTIAEQRGGLTGLRNHIIDRKIIDPEDWQNSYNVYRGATFNLAHNFSQLLYLRPRNRFEELSGCYLVGGGTHPGSGLPVIYESARISCNSLCRHRGVPFETPTPLEKKF